MDAKESFYICFRLHCALDFTEQIQFFIVTLTKKKSTPLTASKESESRCLMDVMHHFKPFILTETWKSVSGSRLRMTL